MTQLQNSRRPRRGRIFPEYTIPLEELKRRDAEREERCQRCRVVFEEVRPQLIDDHYNWFMIIEPNTGDYFIDPNQDVVVQKARQQYPDNWLVVFRLNETGTCGKI